MVEIVGTMLSTGLKAGNNDIKGAKMPAGRRREGKKGAGTGPEDLAGGASIRGRSGVRRAAARMEIERPRAGKVQKAGEGASGHAGWREMGGQREGSRSGMGGKEVVVRTGGR